MLKILTVILLTITQTHAASGDVAVEPSGELSIFFTVMGVLVLIGLVGLFLCSNAHKTYGKGESRKEFIEKMRKAGRKDLPSD